MANQPFTLEDIQLLIRGLDAIQDANLMADSMIEALSKRLPDGERKSKEEPQEKINERHRKRREQLFKTHILKGKLAAIALEIEQAQGPFASMTEFSVKEG